MRCVTHRNGRKVSKIPYSSRPEARRALRHMYRRKGLDIKRFTVYRCSDCRKYHSGKKKAYAYA
jgi:hypothetical protein